jgi:HD-like signal output (HDOD) protein
VSLCASEREWLGFDHCLLGERIAEAWKFPSPVQAAIRFHHGSQQCESEDINVVRCVEIANVICTIKGISSVGLRLVEPPLDAAEALEFHKEDIVILATDLDRELAANENLFEL